MTITLEQREAIAAFVNTHHIPSGLGTKEEACSIAAINIALTGQLTDTIPAWQAMTTHKTAAEAAKAAETAWTAAAKTFWANVNPVHVLTQLIAVTDKAGE